MRENEEKRSVESYDLHDMGKLIIPFEETLKRHQTKPNCNDFGEEAMRRWWREKDFSDVLNEVSITSERDIESIVSDICNTVINN